MGRIGNAWQLTKASWGVLSKDRALIGVPVLAGIAALLAAAAIALPGLVLVGTLDNAPREHASEVPSWIVLAIAGIVALWIVTIGQAAIISGATERMEGRDSTLGAAFASALGRAFRLLEWVVLATAVSVVLDAIEQRFGAVGRMISWIGGMAFRVLSFLALPVIVCENVGAIEGFKRSSTLLKRTWGEQITFSFGLGLLAMLASLPGVIIGGALIGTGAVPIQVIGGVLIVVWVGVVWAVQTALSAVFKTALYRHANDLPVDPAFGEEILRDAFHPRRSSTITRWT